MVSVPFPNNGSNKNFKKDFNNENAGLVPPQNAQAEDGIRDVERSRGLGDVYKRQLQRKNLNYEYLGQLCLFYQYLFS